MASCDWSGSFGSRAIKQSGCAALWAGVALLEMGVLPRGRLGMENATMPYYLERKIELTPRPQTDGTWVCAFRIIEFRPTSWGYLSGCADGSYTSREEAAAAALAAAKRIVDSLECSTEVPRSEPKSPARRPGDRMSKLTFYFLHGVENLGKFRS
jgi:hypothetical protein